MKTKRMLACFGLLLAIFGCYGSPPPEPPCFDLSMGDSVATETRIQRDMSRRPKRIWHVRRDSTGSWIPHGRDVHYFLNGQASAIEWYRDGKLDGASSYWHENGAKQGEITYRTGKAQGVARTWYDQGQVESERTWVDGALEGLERRWDRRGHPVLEIVWRGNKIVERREFHD